MTTAPVSVVQEAITIRATGSFTAAESSQVSPQVPGQVIATPVNVGDTLKAGDVIARLDDRDARARLAQAMPTLQQAQATAANAKAQMDRSASTANRGYRHVARRLEDFNVEWHVIPPTSLVPFDAQYLAKMYPHRSRTFEEAR